MNFRSFMCHVYSLLTAVNNGILIVNVFITHIARGHEEARHVQWWTLATGSILLERLVNPELGNKDVKARLNSHDRVMLTLSIFIMLGTAAGFLLRLYHERNTASLEIGSAAIIAAHCILRKWARD